jgi:sugar/nucleoside kinase (ribokinase family)
LGQEYRNQLQSIEGVNTDFLCTSIADNMSGTAHIVVAKNGSNQIVVVPGANYDLQEENIHEVISAITLTHTHLLTHLTHSFIHSLTHSLTHLLTHLTHSGCIKTVKSYSLSE